MKYSDEEIIAYVNGELDENIRQEMDDWIASSEAARKRVDEFRLLEQAFAESPTFDPAADLLDSFRKRLAEEKEQVNHTHTWFQIAAAILLIIGGFGAGRISTDSTRLNTDFVTLRNEVQVLQRMVMINTLKDHTASERLQVINMIDDTASDMNEELISTLIRTMNNDESPNVRFAAVQTLGNYTAHTGVREQMVRSLGEEDDPLVQIALINELTEADEKTAIAPIRKIAANEALPDEVRRTAEMALELLI